MMKRSVFLMAALGLLGSLAFVSPSRAASISYMSTVVPATTPLPSSNNVAVTQFNTAFGTLTSITFTTTVNVDGSVATYNITGSPIAFTNAFATVPVNVTGPGPLSFTSNGTATLASGTAAPGLDTSYPSTSGSGTGATTLTNPASFAPYEGNGSSTVNLAFSASNASFGGSSASPGSVFFGGTATAGGFVTVTYNFTPAAVPEPTSMALLGIGMTSFLAFRRFFKRSTV